MQGIDMMSVLEAARGLAYSLGPVEQIPLGEGRVFEVDGRSIAVFRTRQGEVFATQAACPHREGPLCDGIIGGRQVVCPLHAYKFDLATGKPVGNDCEALRTYVVSVSESGDILLSSHD
ncbi:MAG: Rieske 2Fe-2S domain-containing protein [Chloroflexi bacterium]|nr:Rieske 2Fe-2S domain-containing protein [Chloroflexota bacterium]